MFVDHSKLQKGSRGAAEGGYTMANQTSAWFKKGIPCAIALALGCAPKAGELSAQEPDSAAA